MEETVADEPPVADVVPAEEAEEKEEDACSKAEKTSTVKKIGTGLLSKSLKSVIEPLRKENAELKARLEKIEKQPLPRKDAKEGDKAVKVEKYQDVRLEKKDEPEFTEELRKDIVRAQQLVEKGSQNWNKEERAFCERVADRRIAEKLSK